MRGVLNIAHSGYGHNFFFGYLFCVSSVFTLLHHVKKTHVLLSLSCIVLGIRNISIDSDRDCAKVFYDRVSRVLTFVNYLSEHNLTLYSRGVFTVGEMLQGANIVQNGQMKTALRDLRNARREPGKARSLLPLAKLDLTYGDMVSVLCGCLSPIYVFLWIELVVFY